MDTHLRDSYGRGSSKKFYWYLDGKEYRIGNVCSFIKKQGLFSSENVDDIKVAGKETEYGSHVEEVDDKC